MHKFKNRLIKKTKGIEFDKYDLYQKSVQAPDADAEFLFETYKELRGLEPKTLREDFCGTFALSCEWVRLKKDHVSYGLDIDPEPIEYGRRRNLVNLKPHQQNRLHIIEKNVLDLDLPKADVSVALNFSYFLFKKRLQMKAYFANVLSNLNKNGLFICDVFGGSQCFDAIEDRHRYGTFTYYWDQTGFDPVSNEATFYIHFRKGSKKYEKVFTYDWRLWSIPELREILHEVGFRKTHIYWEGTTRKGEGNGVFTRTEHGEPCLSWIAYIVSEK